MMSVVVMRAAQPDAQAILGLRAAAELWLHERGMSPVTGMRCAARCVCCGRFRRSLAQRHVFRNKSRLTRLVTSPSLNGLPAAMNTAGRAQP
jgi:hypothetical protein